MNFNSFLMFSLLNIAIAWVHLKSKLCNSYEQIILFFKCVTSDLVIID